MSTKLKHIENKKNYLVHFTMPVTWVRRTTEVRAESEAEAVKSALGGVDLNNLQGWCPGRRMYESDIKVWEAFEVTDDALSLAVQKH